MLQKASQALGSLEHGIQQLRQKEAVQIVKAPVAKCTVSVATAVIDDQIIPFADPLRLSVQRVLRLSLEDVRQLQKTVIVKINVLDVPMASEDDLLLCHKWQCRYSMA
jgi:hypothetical protein